MFLEKPLIEQIVLNFIHAIKCFKRSSVGVVAQMVKGFLYMHENLSLDSSHPHKSVTLVLGPHCLASPAGIGPVGDSLSRKENEGK